MPFDEGNRCWKVRLFNQERVSRGFIVLARYIRNLNGDEELHRYGDRTWPGRPRPRHFETRYLWGRNGDPRYLLLIYFGHEFTEDDYALEFSDRQTAEWLVPKER